MNELNRGSDWFEVLMDNNLAERCRPFYVGMTMQTAQSGCDPTRINRAVRSFASSAWKRDFIDSQALNMYQSVVTRLFPPLTCRSCSMSTIARECSSSTRRPQAPVI